ncbi:MAG: glycosyltransferase family 2 protein [Bacteroidetes bacterium]|nr:glycosyltransferase family 2 protein [Bacteroidota bacterium]HNR19113.1 glycosyltransferase family 2 protein [Bacteroidia bacterium]HNU33669.1 glycosyltransferase family 2 protein [Bacteroidia bacterium]
MHNISVAVVVPLANEEVTFQFFIDALKNSLINLPETIVYLVTDNVSKDNTVKLCNTASTKNKRFKHLHAPENKNVVDAYLAGIKEAVRNKHDFIIEMDGGMSHNPAQLVDFVEQYKNGYECVWGSRYVSSSAENKSFVGRKLLSRTGTVLANLLLGTKLKDTTSGYQGFSLEVAKQLTEYPLKSTAHFYQTEVRYLLRLKKQVEIPIQYHSPSPNVKLKFVLNAINVLLYYFICRITGNAKSIR